MTGRIPQNIKKALTQLEEAAIADSWSGAGHPEDREDIKQARAKARTRVENLILKLIEGK